ncbi:MAG: VWA domain-containing protein [Panacagrimonas sp.]
MLRVARVARANYEALRGPAGMGADDLGALTDLQNRLHRSLQRRVPASTLSVFARPTAASEPGYVDWYSDLEGQPVALGALPEAQRNAVRTKLGERLAMISQGLDELAARDPGQAQEIADLRKLLSFPGDESIYVMNGEPVITFWGHRKQGAALPAAALAPAAAVAGAGAAAVVATRRRLWPWLLALLALLLLLALLCWFWFCREPVPEIVPPLPPPPVEQAEPVPEPEPEPAVEPEPEPDPPVEEVVPDPLEALRGAIDAADCTQLRKLLDTEPLLQSAGAPNQALRQIASAKQATCELDRVNDQIKAAAGDCKKLEAIRSGDPALQAPAGALKEIRSKLDQSIKTCQQEQKEEQAQLECPGKRPLEKAPEVVLLFDASGSMEWAVDMSDEESQRMAQQQAGQAVAQVLGQIMGLPGAGGTPGPVVPIERQRITAAKRASRGLVESLPPDVSTGLVLIQGCPQATPVGFYPPAQRRTMLSQIDEIRPLGGTPLGDGVRQAAAMVDGVNRDALIVVLSDGRDSCNVDPCAVARQLARTKPRLKINVIDIQSNGAGRCVAEATGGRMYSASTVDQVAKVTREAAQEAIAPAHCKK